MQVGWLPLLYRKLIINLNKNVKATGSTGTSVTTVVKPVSFKKLFSNEKVAVNEGDKVKELMKKERNS